MAILPKAQKHKIKPVVDFSNILENDDKVIAGSIDQNGINTLIIHQKPEYRTSDGTSAIIKSTKPKDYTFFRHDFNGEKVLKTKIKNEYFNFHNVNFLPNNKILLTCGRCRYVSKTQIDKNARVFKVDGTLLRDFILGDGIEDIKIDSTGNIWTSYYDEGIFGNFGWTEPVGSSGLICWDKLGKKIWEIKPTPPIEYISDCYAMNIDSENNTWFYYYSDFYLVKLSNEKRIEYWQPKIKGSSSINIMGNMVLMAEGYDGKNFELFAANWESFDSLKKINFCTDKGVALKKGHYISSSGANIGFLHDNKIYLTHMSAL